MVRFVVLTTQRSGSIFFCTSLDQVSQVRCLGECCRLTRRLSNRPLYLFAHLLRDTQIDFQALSSPERQHLVGDFLDTVTVAHSGLKASGFKLMYNHVQQIPEVLPWLEDRSVRVIHLIRKNLLKRMLSWIIKLKGGRGHSTGSPVYQGRVYLRCEGLVELLADMESQVEAYRKTFSKAYPYHEVYYEDFVAHRAKESNRIGAFLSVGALGSLASDLVKINSDRVSDIVVNYDEVFRTLEGTRFECFLEESAKMDKPQRKDLRRGRFFYATNV